MLDFLRKARPAAAIVLSIALGACGDDDDPADVAFNEETASEFADAAGEVLTPVLGSIDVSATVANAMIALGGGVALSPALPLEFASRASTMPMLDARSPRVAMSVAAAASFDAQGPVVPDALEGTTFVWSLEDARYVASEETGAPANGIRFLYYAVDPTSGEPSEPLTELGHLDIVDASTASAARMELELVRDAGSETLADYFVEASVGSNLETTTATLRSAGFVSDGDERIDFEMDMVRAESATGGSEDAGIVITNESANATIRLDYELDVLGENVMDEQGSFTIESGSDEAVFEYVAEASAGSSSMEGALLFNGDEVVVFSGVDEDEIEYTRPDGSALTQGEVDALGGMWLGYVFTIFFSYSILLPFLGLLIGF